jgi:hypothetical protein
MPIADLFFSLNAVEIGAKHIRISVEEPLGPASVRAENVDGSVEQEKTHTAIGEDF